MKGEFVPGGPTMLQLLGCSNLSATQRTMESFQLEKPSSQTIKPPPNSQFTPPRRDFSGKASCLCPDQGKNLLQ